MTVPESRADGGSANTIQLAVVHVKSSDSSPGTPVFVGTGGPGGYGLDLVTIPPAALDFTEVFGSVLEDRDFVFFTQRGTEGAIPRLDSPEFDPVESGYIASLEQWSRDEFDTQLQQGLEACRDKFRAEGIDLSAYNSTESAADVNDIREALGFETITYYGQSYGTLLGQFVMRDFPDMLETVVLDGVDPAQHTSYAETNNYPAAFQRLFDACTADEACNASYPDLEGILANIVADFNANPKTVEAPLPDGTTGTFTLNGNAVLDFIYGMIGQGYTSVASVPSTIAVLAADPTPYLPSMIPSPESPVTSFITYLVTCADDPVTSMDAFDIPNQPEMFQDYIYADGIKFVTGCNVLDLPQLPDSSDVPATNDIPALTLNGGLDPATAPEYGELVAASLPQSQNVVIPDGGHIQWRHPCGEVIFDAFLTDPTVPVDASCADPVVFDTPFLATATNADGTASISIDLAAGFHEQAPGQWGNASGIAVALAVLPAGTDPTTAIVENMSQISPTDASMVVDGDPIAGQPTKTVSLNVQIQGVPVALDAWAFATDDATYYVVIIGQPPAGDQLRPQYPALLETVVINAGVDNAATPAASPVATPAG